MSDASQSLVIIAFRVDYSTVNQQESFVKPLTVRIMYGEAACDSYCTVRGCLFYEQSTMIC